MSNPDKQNRDSQLFSKAQSLITPSTTQQKPGPAKQNEHLKRQTMDGLNSQTTDSSQTIESKKAPLTSRNSAPAKSYKYWIDFADLTSMVKYALDHVREMESQEESKGERDNTHQPNRDSQQQLIKYDNNSSIKGMKKCYMIENSKVVTNVYHNKLRSEISQTLHTLHDRILQYQTKYKNKTLRLCFSSQQELYSIFVKIFGSELFHDLTVRKIFSEIWESITLFRETINVVSSHIMNMYFHFKIELFCRGRGLFDTSKSEYLLHKAVFDNNLPLISRLIKGNHEGQFYAEKNELDSGGNTPLILAIKLGYVDCIKVLTDLFTCPKLKSFHNYPCALDVASAIKNKEMIKILLEANQKIKQHYLDLHKEAIFKALESIPDFKIDMHFNCKSNFIPFVKNITPSDTYKIYKQGSKIRLDMTLVGFRNLKSIRGNLSVIFKGRNQENEGELFVVDHDTKSVSNIFNDIAYAKIEKDLEDIMSDQQYQKLYKADKFKMEAEIDKKGEIRSKMIEGYKAEKYLLKTQFTMTKFKININEMQSLQKYKNYEDYQHNNHLYFEMSPHNNVPHGRPDSSMNLKESSNNLIINTQGGNHHISSNQLNQFSATTPNPHFVRVETDNDLPTVNANQLLTQSNKDHNHTNNTIIGSYATNKKTTKKTINASIWLSKSHPLSLDSFLPLLQVLSFSSKQIAKFKDYLMKYQLPKGSFPLKAKVPLFLTMKAAFSLQNLIFDTNDFANNLFTIDEEYMKIRVQNNLSYQLLSQQRLLQWMNQNSPSPNSAAQTLKEIYKLCKTDEDYEEEEEDDESLERANELFNSMLKKVNQSEELLLEMSSFHSEYDSVDLSERQMNDDSFKLGTHAFSKIQTMNQINVRHEGDDDIPVKFATQKQIQEYQYLSNAQKKFKYGRRTSKQSSQKYLLNQTNGEGENIFDSKILEERPTVNYTITKRSFTKNQKPPTNGPHGAIGMGGINTSHLNADQIKTLKKNFQPRNMKNYKNMIKYGCNQSQFEGTVNFSGNKVNPSGNTPPISTADTSLLTNKLGSFFNTQNQLTKKDQNAWFKQILNYKNAITGGAGYLQTIESEEVMGTEGVNDGLSHIGNQTIGENNSVIMTQSNFDDAFSRKSFIQSFNAQNGGSNHGANQNHLNSSRESSLKSFNSGNGGVPLLQQQNKAIGAMNSSFPLQEAGSDLIQNKSQLQGNKSHQHQNNQNMIRDERKALINHNTLISRFHNYVNKQQNNQQLPISTINMLQVSQTPQKTKNGEGSNTSQNLNQQQQFAPQQYNMSKGAISTGSNKQTVSPVEPQIILNSATGVKQQRQNYNQHAMVPNTNNQGNTNSNQPVNNAGKPLLPPKVAHRRQSSYGGSSSNVAAYIGQQQTQNNNQTGSGGIFNKIFGSTFSRSSNIQPQANINQNKTSDVVNPFNVLQQQSSTLDFNKNSESLVAFQTFDHPRQTTSRTTSNTQYSQQVPQIGFGQNKQQTNSAIFMKGLLSHTSGKKTNDVDIFLPYQV